MNQVPDRKKLRKKLRREYLIFGGWNVVLCVTEVLLLTIGYIYIVCNAPHNNYTGRFVLILGLFVALGAFILGHEAKKDHRVTCDRIIPPITPDTLPADEILLRGAQEPSAPNETLLRAGVKSEETKAEELLRSSHAD
jgi:hypothetical protein